MKFSQAGVTIICIVLEMEAVASLALEADRPRLGKVAMADSARLQRKLRATLSE